MRSNREARLFFIALAVGLIFTFGVPLPNPLLPVVPWGAGLTLGPFLMVMTGALLALLYRRTIEDPNRLITTVMAAFFLLYVGIQVFSCPYFHWVGKRLGHMAREKRIEKAIHPDQLLALWLRPRILYPRKKPAKTCLMEGYREGLREVKERESEKVRREG